MTARQLIRNLMTLEDIDSEIPCSVIARDIFGGVESRSKDGEYRCYLSLTNKLIVEKQRDV